MAHLSVLLAKVSIENGTIDMVGQEVSLQTIENGRGLTKVGVASKISRALRTHYYTRTPLQGILHPPLIMILRIQIVQFRFCQ